MGIKLSDFSLGFLEKEFVEGGHSERGCVVACGGGGGGGMAVENGWNPRSPPSGMVATSGSTGGTASGWGGGQTTGSLGLELSGIGWG